MSDLLHISVWKPTRLRVPRPTTRSGVVVTTIVRLERAGALDAGTGDALDWLLAAGVAKEHAHAAEAAQRLRERWGRRLARRDARLGAYEVTLRALDDRERQLLALGDAEVLRAIEEQS